MSPSKLIIGAAIVAAGLAGGAVAASDYPPVAPPSENAVSSSGSAEQTPQASASAIQRAGGQLAETGSDADTLIKVAGGAVVAGAGLVVATRLRRRPALG